MTPSPVVDLEARLASFRERVGRLREELAMSFIGQADAAEIWGDFRDEVTRWRRVARVPLAG